MIVYVLSEFRLREVKYIFVLIPRGKKEIFISSYRFFFSQHSSLEQKYFVTYFNVEWSTFGAHTNNDYVNISHVYMYTSIYIYNCVYVL